MRAKEAGAVVGVSAAGLCIAIGARPRLGIEVSVAVDASDERGGQTVWSDVTHASRDVADADADTAVTSTVRSGAVEHVGVVERELAGAEQERRRPRDIDV